MKLPDVQLNLPNFNLHKLLAFINSEKNTKDIIIDNSSGTDIVTLISIVVTEN